MDMVVSRSVIVELEGYGEVIGDRGGHDRDEAGATEKNHLAAPPPHT